MPIQRERLTEQFLKLVSFDSESYHERAIAEYLKSELRELGLEVTEDNADEILAAEGKLPTLADTSGNIYGLLKGTPDKKPVLFSSHMDTVAPGVGKKAIVHANGKITSDGTTVLGADDAGGLSVILEMLRVLCEDKIPHPDVEVFFPIAEEPYAQGSRVADYSRIRSKYAYVFDLSGEIGTAAFAAPTILSVKIVVRGRSAHAGFEPEKGVHAIAVAAEALSQLRNGWISKHTSVNIGIINGGIASNVVPDRVEIIGEIRSMSDDEAIDESKKIRDVFGRVARKYGADAVVEIDSKFRAYRVHDTSTTVKRFREACIKASLGEARLIETFGGSDNNNFAAHGIEGLVVSSAMQEVHTTQEYTTISDLEKAAALALELARL